MSYPIMEEVKLKPCKNIFKDIKIEDRRQRLIELLSKIITFQIKENKEI